MKNIRAYQIRRWLRMLSGSSIEHVNQNIGSCFAVNDIVGYYNDLTEKVTKNLALLDSNALPMVYPENQNPVYFPVAIFQYGLGAYDLFLTTKEEIYLKKFLQCARWACEHIDEKGRWNNFFFYRPDAPYGAMAQGEGTSLLIRAYKHTGDHKYLEKAKAAIDFMILPVEEGGTTKYEGDDAFLMEYTFKGLVLNGAIFAWWGLYDFVTISNDKGRYKQLLAQTRKSIINILPRFKNSIWSMYSLDGLIASPFYHNLHIAQMQAMYKLTGEEIFEQYANRWRRQQKNVFCKGAAFAIKAYQKIRE